MSDTYDLLVKRRQDIQDWIDKAYADLADVETALAAIQASAQPSAPPQQTVPDISPQDPLGQGAAAPAAGQTQPDKDAEVPW